MTSLLATLQGLGETALDYATPDAIFGNVGKFGDRKKKPYVGKSMLEALTGRAPSVKPTAATVPPADFVAPGDGVTGPSDPSIAAYSGPTTTPALAPTDNGFGQKVKNGFGILDRVLGGRTITSAMEDQRQAQQARADEPRQLAEQAKARSMLEALTQSGKLSPEEAYIARTDPKAFGEILKAKADPKVVGQSIYTNGGFQEAPEQPVVKDGKDGLYLVWPKSGKSQKLSAWAAYAPQRATKAAAAKGTSEAPPTGFTLD